MVFFICVHTHGIILLSAFLKRMCSRSVGSWSLFPQVVIFFFFFFDTELGSPESLNIDLFPSSLVWKGGMQRRTALVKELKLKSVGCCPAPKDSLSATCLLRCSSLRYQMGLAEMKGNLRKPRSSGATFLSCCAWKTHKGVANTRACVSLDARVPL